MNNEYDMKLIAYSMRLFLFAIEVRHFEELEWFGGAPGYAQERAHTLASRPILISEKKNYTTLIYVF